ncbi:MAG: DNA polymerase III subunit epsilon, partial [Crocinitomicaceae bacterium]|nr:DNA polymerase III subunit epsilon [Crocinitomicaceae bacterium]
MKVLIFDVETTGLPIEWEASVYDVDNWPRVVQIAWQLYDEDKKLLKEYNFIIKPDGYVIPNQASHIHNITTAKAIEVGEDIDLVLKLFINSVNQAGLLIAHNYKFDSNVIGAELIRKGHLNVFEEKNYTCTMLETIHFCKAEGK